MNDGVLVFDKPSDMTSFGVVARVRRVLSKQAGKKVKVGHTGTLDPFATGLMLIVVGKECKNAGTYSKLDKVYDATIRLGQTSSTGDPEGELTVVSTDQPGAEAVRQALAKFVGEIEQTPPMFSAIKIGGRRAYDLARAGQTIEMPKRTITIYSLELLDYAYPDISVRAHVSSGTYIRTLAEDIGNELRTGAYCSDLRRIKTGTLSIDQAVPLEDWLEREDREYHREDEHHKSN